MVEFEVMVRPLKALQALGRGNWEPDRPATGPVEGRRGRSSTDFDRF